MANDDLKTSLAEMKKHMADALAESRHDVLSDIIQNVTTLADPEAEVTEEHSQLVKQLEEIEAEFEVDHPNMAAVLRQTIDILKNMGI